MSEHTAVVSWDRRGERFTDNRYSRAHRWEFDGGAVVSASSSPHSVRIPFSDPGGVDPEEAFVAALASCHMLWFLSIAAARKISIDSYRDDAVGVMAPGENGRLAITSVTLRPHIILTAGQSVAPQVIDAIHHEAHEACFIANSVRTLITTAGTCETAEEAARLPYGPAPAGED